jgi:Tfp pilus assembly protein PilF
MALSALGREAEARKAYRQALALDPVDPESLLQAADLELKGGAPDQARDLVRRALAAHPGSFEALVLMARVEEERGDEGRAARWLGRVLEINPYEYRAHAELARLAQERGDWPAAAREFQAALGMNPAHDARMSYGLGYALLRMGRAAEAREAFLAATAQDPRLAEPHLALGLLLIDSEPARARQELEQYLRLAPAGEGVGAAREALEKLAP